MGVLREASPRKAQGKQCKIFCHYVLWTSLLFTLERAGLEPAHLPECLSYTTYRPQYAPSHCHSICAPPPFQVEPRPGAASYGLRLIMLKEVGFPTADWRARPDSNRLPPGVLRVCFLKHLSPMVLPRGPLA